MYYSQNGGNSWFQSTGPPISTSTSYDFFASIASSSTGQFVVAGNYISNGKMETTGKIYMH